jgi:leader peptidase (prepilin peptidase)/N-methyltransferase
VNLPNAVLIAGALLLALAVGPWLARTSVRLAARDEAAQASPTRTVFTTALLGAALTGAVLLGGARPATGALLCAAGAAVVLGAVDLAAHRLPDRVLLPAAAVCVLALAADAAVTGTWPALLRALAAGAAAFAFAALAALVSPDALGFGDVKLLGLLGLVLGWAGWGVLLAGVFLGLVAGALGSLALLVTGRAGWRTAVPFGPPLLLGAALALALAGPLPA